MLTLSEKEGLLGGFFLTSSFFECLTEYSFFNSKIRTQVFSKALCSDKKQF